jgi:hypothetical protein
MGESLMVGVVGEFGRDGRGNRESWGRRQTQKDGSRTRLARLLLGGGRRSWFGEKVAGFL